MPFVEKFVPRRAVLARAAALASLAGCDTGREASAGVASLGTMRSLADLARWRGPGEGAWNPAPMLQNVSMPGEPLGPLRRGLAALAQGGARRQAVSIIQLGDSHTASPVLVPRLRELFQERHGGLGPGRLPPGSGPRFFRTSLVQTEQQGQWTGATALRAATPGPFGIAAYRLRGEGAGSRIVLRSTEREGFDSFRVDVMLRPGAGSFRLLLDGTPGPALPTHRPEPAYHPLVLEPGRRHHEVALELLGDGPVDFLSWGVERRGAGVLVEGFGINGATIDMLSHMDQSMLRSALVERNPALIILAFGTNEAVSERITEAEYAAQFGERVRMLKRYAPGAGILVMGAPDAGRRQRSAGCDGWAPLPGLGAVRAAQRQVARTEGCEYWEWSALTAGACGFHQATRAAPALMAADHIHFTADGYRLTADRLFAHLTGAATPRSV